MAGRADDQPESDVHLLTYSSLTGSNGARGTMVQVSEPALHRLLRSVLENVFVDEAWYRRAYGDVRDAIRQGKLATARDHYVDVGYFENRFPCEIGVDERWYRATYKDVAEAIKKGLIASGQEHFEKEGYREGRLPRDGWTLLDEKAPVELPELHEVENTY